MRMQVKNRLTKEILVWLGALGFAVVIAAPSHASPITFEFTGILPTVSQGLDPVFSPPFAGGEMVKAIYTFDSELVNIYEPGSNYGYYRSLSAFKVQIGGLSWELGAGSYIYLQNLFDNSGGMDWYYVEGESPILGPTIAMMNPFAMSVQMASTAFDFITSDALPLTPPDLTQFLSPVGGSGYAAAKIQLVFLDSNNFPYYLDAGIVSAQAASVPEPGILILLGISVMSLAGLRRWWKE